MKKPIFIAIASIFILIVGGLIFYFFQTVYPKLQEQAEIIGEMSEIMDAQKESLEENYQNLLSEYSTYKIDSQNDSLLYLLDAEKAKVQRLLEELRTVKSTNARRIKELTKELETLRIVMRSYVAQIDSLNQANQTLRQQNREVTQKYAQATQTVSRLSQEKETLTEKVVLASKLSATGISVIPVNKKGKTEKKVKNITQITICFTITKNITAETGEKAIYVRIAKPDDDILIKNPGNLFRYENKSIPFSIRKIVEYEGEDLQTCVYWQVEEFLFSGNYRVDIFTDGNLIGSKGFVIGN
ncbi:MAG: hypothetical protein LBD45_08735 [Bacteroidales bacterium]|jgi:hypothetical protein|nr:hypothetical protein [Bacteroidales bacterium]